MIPRQEMTHGYFQRQSSISRACAFPVADPARIDRALRISPFPKFFRLNSPLLCCSVFSRFPVLLCDAPVLFRIARNQKRFRQGGNTFSCRMFMGELEGGAGPCIMMGGPAEWRPLGSWRDKLLMQDPFRPFAGGRKCPEACPLSSYIFVPYDRLQIGYRFRGNWFFLVFWGVFWRKNVSVAIGNEEKSQIRANFCPKRRHVHISATVMRIKADRFP